MTAPPAGSNISGGKMSDPTSSCSSCSGKSTLGTIKDSPESQMQRQDKVIASTLSKIKYKLFVMSGKGGVGKSSVSTNLAAALAIKGYKVGLLDVDIHGPSVPHLLGLTGLLDIDPQKGIQPKRYSENLAVVSMESLLKDPDQAVLWKGPMKTSAIRQFVSDVDWGELDFLVIDSPPGTGDEPMAVLKTVPDALSIVITTPQEISLADVRKSINFLQYVKANILGVVENMSGLICPHCAQKIDLFKKGGGEELAKKYSLAFLGAIPLDPATVVAGDMGRPVVMLDVECPAKTALLQLADKVVEAAENSLEAVSSSHV